MRDKILTDLFKSKEFNDCISKMRPEHLQDDLKGEVMLILCEMEEGKLMDLHYKGVLRFYTVRVILNLIQSSTSPFYKKFRMSGFDLTSIKSSVMSGSYDFSLLEAMDSENINLVHRKVLEAISFEDLGEQKEKQLKECLALDEIDNLYWYDREIVKLYLELGTYRAVEEATGIPFESVYKTVIKSCRQIKKKVA